MAEPAKKNPDIRAFQSQLLGRDVEASIRADVCAICGGPAAEFRTELSRKEFTMSGMCQSCQDKFFDKGEG